LDFIESCRKFISLDSTPSQGNMAVAKLAAELGQSKGFAVETMEEVWGGQPQMNVLLRPRQNSKQKVEQEFLLQTHLDTPDPGPFGLWAKTGHNPFDAHIIEGKIFGLGVADAKLDFLCKLEALASFSNQENWKTLPVVAGTFCEEQGMHGTLKLIRKNKIKAKKALIGEASGLKLIHAGKGMAAVEIRIPFEADESAFRADHNLRESSTTHSKIFNGKSAHSSAPQLGDSAIKKMFEYMLLMPENLAIMEVEGGVNFNTVPASAWLEIDPVAGHKQPMARKLTTIYRALCDLENEFLQFEDESFRPSIPTLNIGIVRTLENHVFISGNCRINPSVSFETYQSWINRLKEVCQGQDAEFRVTDYKMPFMTDVSSDFAQGCLADLKELGLDAKPVTQPSINEASLFSRVGIECLCFGPGQREGNAHTPEEQVEIKDLYSAIEFYKKAIARFCL
jgi:acetylornithine deacetylase/succinyl-diaminopimelate desuccinylase-like protein